MEIKEICDSIFYAKKGFYPSLSILFQKIRDKNKDLLKQYRKEIEKYYNAQDIIQIFRPPPKSYSALQRKDGYYPKIISFFPWERLYCDTGFITIYNQSRQKGKKKVDVVSEEVKEEIVYSREQLEEKAKSLSIVNFGKWAQDLKLIQARFQKPPNNSKLKSKEMVINEILSKI